MRSGENIEQKYPAVCGNTGGTKILKPNISKQFQSNRTQTQTLIYRLVNGVRDGSSRCPSRESDSWGEDAGVQKLHCWWEFIEASHLALGSGWSRFHATGRPLPAAEAWLVSGLSVINSATQTLDGRRHTLRANTDGGRAFRPPTNTVNKHIHTNAHAFIHVVLTDHLKRTTNRKSHLLLKKMVQSRWADWLQKNDQECFISPKEG